MDNEFDFVFVRFENGYVAGLDPQIVNPSQPTRCKVEVESSGQDFIFTIVPAEGTISLKAPQDVDGIGAARGGVLYMWESLPMEKGSGVFVTTPTQIPLA